MISVKKRDQFLRKTLPAEKIEVVPLRSEAMILLLPVPLPDDGDSLFHPTAQANLMLFAHIMHNDTKKNPGQKHLRPVVAHLALSETGSHS